MNSLEPTASEQGVRQDWPSDVLASAPAGSDSNCMLVLVGADFRKPGVSNCIQLGRLEHAVRLNPHATTATTRFMTDTVHSSGPMGRVTQHSGNCGLVTRIRLSPCDTSLPPQPAPRRK